MNILDLEYEPEIMDSTHQVRKERNFYVRKIRDFLTGIDKIISCDNNCIFRNIMLSVSYRPQLLPESNKANQC